MRLVKYLVKLTTVAREESREKTATGQEDNFLTNPSPNTELDISAIFT